MSTSTDSAAATLTAFINGRKLAVRTVTGFVLKIGVDSRHRVVVMASLDKVLPIHRGPSGRGTRGTSNGRGRNGRPGQAEDQCRGSAKDQSAARNPSELYGAHVTPQT